jgi:hypothetical protein
LKNRAARAIGSELAAAFTCSPAAAQDGDVISELQWYQCPEEGEHHDRYR